MNRTSRASAISVVIPCFNGGRYLPETLATLRAQTRKPDEILVVDDGSTDPQTLGILSSLPRDVQVVRQENQGLGRARNAGIRAARGELVLPLDCDDLLAPDALARYEAALARHPEASFAYSHVEFFGAVQGSFYVPRFNGYLELDDNMLVATALIRRSVFTESGVWYPPLRAYEDWSFWLSCIEAGLSGVVVEARLFRYRRKHAEGLLFEANQTQQKLRHQIRQMHPSLYSPEGRARLKKQFAPGLEILWKGAPDDPSVERFVAGQTLRDVVVTKAPGSPSALLAGRRGKYVVEMDSSHTPLLARARPSFLEQVVQLLEGHPEKNAVCVPTDAPSLLAARRRPRVSPASRARAPADADLVFVRTSSFRLAAASAGRKEGATALLRSAVGTGKAFFLDYDFFRVAEGEAEPSLAPAVEAEDDVSKAAEPAIWQTRARSFRRAWRVARALSVAAIGEERTSRLIHPLRSRFESATLRSPQPQQPETSERRLTRYLLPRSRRAELLLLDRIPVEMTRLVPVTAGARKRLALVLPWLTTGGVERAAIDMAAALRDRYELHVITGFQSPHEWEHRMVPHVADVLHLGDALAPKDQPGRIVQVLRDRGIDGLFMSNSWLGYEAAMATRRHLPGVRTLDLQHTDFQAKGGDFARQSCERYDRYLDLRLVVSNYLRDRYIGYGVSPGKIRVVHLSCDEGGAFNPERVPPGWLHERLSLPYEAKIVGFIGRLVDDKDPLFVTRVYAAIRRQWSDSRHPLHFVFIGEGVLKRRIKEEARSQGLEREVHFLPADTPMPRAMRDLDLVLMSSRIEGLPIVFIEAMALEVPVVSTRLEGIPELVDDEVGACVPNVRDELKRLDLLRNAALPILESEDLRLRMGQNARRRVVKDFSQERTAQAYRLAFAELLGEQAPGSRSASSGS